MLCAGVFLQRKPFRKGDQVLISDDMLQVMQLQEGHGGWIPDMQAVCRNRKLIHIITADVMTVQSVLLCYVDIAVQVRPVRQLMVDSL